MSARWAAFLAHLEEHRSANGCAPIPVRYRSPDGYRLGQQASWWRSRRAAGQLPAERMAQLDALCFEWTPRRARITAALECVLAEGRLAAPVGPCARYLRHACSRSRLTLADLVRLDAAGFPWSKRDVAVAGSLPALDDYLASHGHLPRRADGTPAGRLAQRLRRYRSWWVHGSLTPHWAEAVAPLFTAPR